MIDDQPSAGPRLVTLAEVAGKRINLLICVALPVYVAGAVLTGGLTRWIMIMIAVGLVAAAAGMRDRRVSPGQVPSALLVSFAISAMWGRLAPDLPLLAMGFLATATVYAALMLPRPYAEISIVGLPAVQTTTELIVGLQGRLLAAIAMAVMNVALGILLLAIRVITERLVTEHTRSLADVNARLEQLNRVDAMTGLANRRELEETLGRVWTRARRTERPVSVLMIDVDHFKQYNDHYGHLAGDACLRKVATAIAGAIRETDVAARYGGEEFAIIVPEAGAEEAALIAERVRQAVAALGERHVTADGVVSVSVGVASAEPHAGDTVEALLDRADRCLYEAKRGGRNAVSVQAGVRA